MSFIDRLVHGCYVVPIERELCRRKEALKRTAQMAALRNRSGFSGSNTPHVPI